MNMHEFTYLLQHPQSITTDQIGDVKTIIDEFPYFQSARAIYLKGLKDQESFKYNQELKTTAAYTTDRSILFDFITSEEFLQNEISEHIKRNTEHLKDIEVKDIEDVGIEAEVQILHLLRELAAERSAQLVKVVKLSRRQQRLPPGQQGAARFSGIVLVTGAAQVGARLA